MHGTPLQPFGINLGDVPIQSISPDNVEQFLRLLCRHRVAVMRNQDCDDAAFVAFLQQLGETMFTDGETPAPGTEALNIVSNVGRDRPPRSVFHTDTSYVEKPPAYTALRAIAVPESGGATLFTDQVQALRDLPASTSDWLAGRTIRHAYTAPGLPEEAHWHPAIRRHPVTGEDTLYLSTPERCDRISDTDADAGERTIAELYSRSMGPGLIYRHEWRPGDIVIWDNRATMHRADHSAVVGDRVFHRGMVRGERPLAA